MNNYSSLVELIIKSEMEGKPHHEPLLVLGDTPQLLQQHAGFPPYKMAIKASIISKAAFDHGIDTGFLKRLPQILNSPKAIFNSASPNATNSVVVLTYELKGVAPIIIPVRHSQKIGRHDTYNLVASIYGKEGPDPVKKWTDQGLHVWSDT